MLPEHARDNRRSEKQRILGQINGDSQVDSRQEARRVRLVPRGKAEQGVFGGSSHWKGSWTAAVGKIVRATCDSRPNGQRKGTNITLDR